MDVRKDNIDDMMSAALPSSAAQVLSALEGAGYEAYAVGGCVRDVMLGKTPHDWDITTSAIPAQMKDAVPFKSFDTGIQHGTVTFMVEGEPIEVTVYRTDGKYSDGRHPDFVSFAKTVGEDLSRRDFTVNAMAWSPSRGLADPFGGFADLGKNCLRCVGVPQERFGEDGLRVMRALRFAAVYGFDIEEETAAAVHSCRHMLAPVARERISAELVKMLSARDASHLAGLMDDFHDVVFEFAPELEEMYGYDQGSVHHSEDLWHHSLSTMENVDSDEPMVRLAALIHDIGKPACRTVGADGNAHYYGHMEAGRAIAVDMMQRMKFSRAEIDEVAFIVSQHDNRPSDTKRSVRRFIAKCGSAELARKTMAVMISDASVHSSEKALAAAAKLERASEMMESEFENDAMLSMRDMEFSGKDLIAMGWEPGPEMGAELARLFSAVVDGKLENDRDAISSEVRRHAESLPEAKREVGEKSPRTSAGFGVSVPVGSDEGYWVSPYVRANGVKVRGHWRRRRR